MIDHFKNIFLSLGIMLVFSTICIGQSTEWTYQGRLLDNTLPPTANYDFEFSLWNSLVNGTQQGSTQTISGVAVANGIFTVRLNFGAQFDGSARFLQIAMRPAGGGAFTTLAPRQPITSGPYAIRSLNSTTADTATNSINLGGVAASQYVVTTDPRMTDARNPLPNSANYIWNQNSVLQPSSNFIISGNGEAGGTLSANLIRAESQFNIGAARVLSVAGTDNVFAGVGAGAVNTASDNAFFGRNAGAVNTTGNSNSFFGRNSGLVNTTGSDNAFFGANAGDSNTTGGENSFFGRSAGGANTTGGNNSFFGRSAGQSNTTGDNNSFYGSLAGFANTTGANNSFFGDDAGRSNTTGLSNAFFGANAGYSNTTGGSNSFFGNEAGAANTVGEDNAFFGSFAGWLNTASANSFFGSGAGTYNQTGGDNAFFGSSAGLFNEDGYSNSFFGSGAGRSNTQGWGNSFFGVAAGYNTDGVGNSFFGGDAGRSNTDGAGNAFFGVSAGLSNTTGNNNTMIGATADVGAPNLSFATAIGAGAVVTASNRIQIGRAVDAVRIPGGLRIEGLLAVETLDTGGTTALCSNGLQRLSTCSSSLRYKTNINRFGLGLALIKQLRPITFDWKTGGMRDLGLGAEDVAAIEPLLVTYNNNGEVEGVKYDRIGVIAINAIKEQQEVISSQQSAISAQKLMIEQLQTQLNALKKLVCAQNPMTELCKSAEVKP